MTTIVSAICPLQNVAPAGIVLVSDTRSTPVRLDGAPSDRKPYDATWKVVQVGQHALGAYAGLGLRGLRALVAVADLFRDKPFPPRSPQTIETLVRLLEQGSAIDEEAPNVAIPQEVEVVVGFVDSSGGYNLVTWSNQGLQSVTADASHRGPFFLGTGGQSQTRRRFESELQGIVAKDGGRIPLGLAKEIWHQAAMVAAAFSNAYLDEEADPATGGGVQIYTISKADCIEEFELWPYVLAEGDEVDKGRWVQKTPPVLTSMELDRHPVPGRFAASGEIVSLVSDHHDHLFALSRAVTLEVGPVKSVTKDEIPAEALAALYEKFGPNLTFSKRAGGDAPDL